MMKLEQRAGVHAALGEPVRLAIVDRLIPGDASPGELAAQFSLPTNLMAHHLKVLEEAGIIERIRSEGDRRRSYVRLRLENPVIRAAATADLTLRPAPARVVFVCTANSARSQLAAATWNRLSHTPALSGGTRPARRIHPRTVTAGRRHGLRLGRSPTKSINEILQPDDLLIAVCDTAHEALSPDRDRLHWSIPDPVRVDTDDAFEIAYADIDRRVHQLADTLER